MGKTPHSPRSHEPKNSGYSWPRWTVLFFDLIVLGLATATLGTVPTLADFAIVALAVRTYGHDSPFRWRTNSLLLFGTLLATLVAVAMSAGVWLLEVPTLILSHPWLVAVAVVAGHMLARVVDAFRSRDDVRLVGAGRLRRATIASLNAPFSGCRVSHIAQATVLIPRGRLGDRGIAIATPRGPREILPEGPTSGMGYAVKRTMDLLLVGLITPFALPLVAFLAILVRVTSRGPAFYTQERLSLDEQPFLIVKLRSMVADAECDGQPIWPKDCDDRITPLGRLLRRTWLDELPQLWNVATGSMSLVGPRPERPAFVQEFRERLPNYPLRHQARSGMTGLAQVVGLIGNTSLERRLIQDVRYVRLWNPLLDLAICLRTGFKMIRRLPSRGSPDS